jgi:hypothetical protein
VSNYKFVVDVRHFSWVSQFDIGVGRLDLLLTSEDGCPLLVIEAKTTAAFQDKQLERYGKWIQGQRAAEDKKTWPGALVLLTHSVPPPEGFLIDDPTADHFGVGQRSLCTWSEVFRWLVEFGTSGHETWHWLARELAKFIKEMDMSAETIALDDISAADVFIRSASRFAATFDLIYARTKEPNVAGRILSGNRAKLTYTSDARTISEEYFVANPPSPARQAWKLEWGVRLSGLSDWWSQLSIAVPKMPVAYAYLHDNSEEHPLPIKQLIPQSAKLSGWRETTQKGDGWESAPWVIAVRELHTFVATNDNDFGIAVADWVAQRINDLQERIAP